MAASSVACSWGGRRRALRSGVVSAGLGVVLVATPLAVVAVVAQVVSDHALTATAGLASVSRGDVAALVVALGAMAAWLPGAAAALVEVRGRDRPVRRSKLLSPSIHRVVAQGVEVSLAGVGTLAGWTSTRVDARLDDLVRPRPRVAAVEDAPGEASPSPASATPLPVVPAPAPRPGGVVHTVARGETWWSLAQRYLGEGSRFAELKQANVGRAQPDGAVVGPDSVLRSGWTVVVPTTGPRR